MMKNLVREPKRSALRVENLTRGETLVSDGWVADGYWSRMRGLIGHKPLEQGQGLVIVPCNSIHTHFMCFAIDVVYVDRSCRVMAVDERLAPWHLGRIRRGARFVIELPAGTASATHTEAGDQLALQGYEL
jgi:uncharacterized membrane protein (UPF0127 family)